MLKIYGANLSSPANKIRFVANALGLDYEYIQISIRDGENQTEEYKKLHPAGKVPAIDDDGFVLFESDAIAKYLAASQRSPLYPEDIKQRAKVDQWMDFSSIHINAAMGRVMFNRIFAPVIKAPVDQNSLNDGIKFLGRFLPVVDAQLSRSKYLASDELTLADFSLLSSLDPAEAAEIDLAPYPNLVKWRSDLMKRDFYTKCHSSYGDVLKALMARAS